MSTEFLLKNWTKSDRAHYIWIHRWFIEKYFFFNFLYWNIWIFTFNNIRNIQDNILAQKDQWLHWHSYKNLKWNIIPKRIMRTFITKGNNFHLLVLKFQSIQLTLTFQYFFRLIIEFFVGDIQHETVAAKVNPVLWIGNLEKKLSSTNTILHTLSNLQFWKYFELLWFFLILDNLDFDQSLHLSMNN